MKGLTRQRSNMIEKNAKLDTEEILNYLGVKEDPEGAMIQVVKDEADKLLRVVRPRYVYRLFPLEHAPEGVLLRGSGVTMPGDMAGRMLAQCGQAALLACTLGAGFDAMLRAAQARDMARAVILDACGSALVEAGCDRAEREIAGRCPGQHLTDRFSPGYGDLPLDVQNAICTALDAPKRLGIQVTESHLMNPSKTVTAVIGLAARPQPARIRGCAYCALAGTCILREGRKSCAD